MTMQGTVRAYPVAGALAFVLLALPLAADHLNFAVSEPLEQWAPGARSFYLTAGDFAGDEVLGACAYGYHLASIYELLDPSNLVYDTQLGLTAADSGAGPIADQAGWVRTGTAGGAGWNCDNWSSDSPLDSGLLAWLGLTPEPIRALPMPAPWNTEFVDCAGRAHAWCVSDTGH